MSDAKDFELFLKDSEILLLKKKLEEFENGEIYCSLLREIAQIRTERDKYIEEAKMLEAVRRVIEC